jgi:hypothetical protein
VKVTAEDLARHYGAMSDGELLSIDRGELHDLARTCYERELARRSLESGEPDSGEAGEGGDAEAAATEDSVSVATFTNQQAAHLAQSALEAAGIASFVEKETEGLHLMVGESWERDAREVLGSLSQMSASLVEEWLRETLHTHTVMIEDMLAEDDLVAARLTVDGKHQAFCFARIAGEKVAETWHNFDQLRLL